jgi:hypothetical protein
MRRRRPALPPGNEEKPLEDKLKASPYGTFV